MQFSFSENQEVQSLDSVPEQFRSLYGEKEGGGFTLKTGNPAVKGAIEAILGLDKALKATRTERDTASKRAVDLTPLAEYGDSVEVIAATVQAKLAEASEQLAKGAKINPDKIREEVAATFKKDIDSRDARVTALTSQLTTIMVDNAITASAIEKDVNADAELIPPFIRPHVKMVEKDGKMFAAVVDKDGEVRYSGLTGLPMTIKELMLEMKAAGKHAKLFNSEAGNGAGTQQEQRRTPAQFQQQQRTEQLSSVQKISSGLAKGQHMSRRHANN